MTAYGERIAHHNREDDDMSTTQQNHQEAGAKTTTDFDAVIVGAGFSGLYMLHRLRNELGFVTVP